MCCTIACTCNKKPFFFSLSLVCVFFSSGEEIKISKLQMSTNIERERERKKGDFTSNSQLFSQQLE